VSTVTSVERNNNPAPHLQSFLFINLRGVLGDSSPNMREIYFSVCGVCAIAGEHTHTIVHIKNELANPSK
jgi:hypothetical protein